MMWLTWRQFRAQAVVASAALAVVAVVMVTTGIELVRAYDAIGIPGCQPGVNCQSLASSFLSQYGSGSAYSRVGGIATALALLAPAMIGIFWGAPLIAREFEPGTLRLAWNQSVLPTRWIAVKLAVIGLASMAAAGLLSLLMTWWLGPVHSASVIAGSQSPVTLSRFYPVFFASAGIVPIGYAAFAFALGVTAGVLTRRLVPAMAVTLVVFAVVQVLWPVFVRPHLISPAHAVLALPAVSLAMFGQGPGNSLLMAAGARADDWILSSQAVNAAGHAVRHVPRSCLSAFNGSPSAFLHCLAGHGIKVAVTYQPGSRYWAFQCIETGIFLAMAAALACFCYRRLSRRRLG
jgi:hypothetical protein